MLTCKCLMLHWDCSFRRPFGKKNFTSSDPHQDIYTFCYWQIFWHSIWHIFWHSIWHSIWHIFWHSTWHIFWHIFWHSIWHIFWHFIWKSSGILSGISSGILSDILSGVLSGISSGILSGRWGPAVPTELGRSQVDVQWCPLSSEGPRLRSSGAHWARKVPGWGPAVPTALGTLRLRSSRAHSDRQPAVEVQQCPLPQKLAKRLAKSWQVGSGHGSGCRGGGGEGGGRGEGGGEEQLG